MTMLHETLEYLQQKLRFFKEVGVYEQIREFKEECMLKKAKRGEKEINLGDFYGLSIKMTMDYVSPEVKEKRKGKK